MREASELGPAGLLLATVASRLHFVQRIAILLGHATTAPDILAILSSGGLRARPKWAPTSRNGYADDVTVDEYKKWLGR